MIVKLFQPPTTNWLLIAEDLDDPPTWDRFVPCHTVESQRWRFDCMVKETAKGRVQLKPCRDLLRIGVSVFEYSWETAEGEILAHAMLVADNLGLELMMEAPAPTGPSYSAA